MTKVCDVYQHLMLFKLQLEAETNEANGLSRWKLMQGI